MNAAEVVSADTPPYTEVAGPTPVSFALKNTGSTVWTAGGTTPFGLGAVNLDGTPWVGPLLWTDIPNGNPATNGVGRLGLSADVPPGGTVTLTKNLYAADNVLTPCAWRMVANGAGWFGPTIARQVWVCGTGSPLFPAKPLLPSLVGAEIVNSDRPKMATPPPTDPPPPGHGVYIWRWQLPEGAGYGPFSIRGVDIWTGFTGPQPGYPDGPICDYNCAVIREADNALLAWHNLDHYTRFTALHNHAASFPAPGFRLEPGQKLRVVVRCVVFNMPEGANWTHTTAVKLYGEYLP